MIFNSKYAHINNLFAELGCTIGKLGDSSKYNERFIDIADRVIALNEGGKVDRKVLSADVDLMLGMLEKEGYVKESRASEVIYNKAKKNSKMPSILTAPFRLIKSYWPCTFEASASLCFPYLIPNVYFHAISLTWCWQARFELARLVILR